MLSVRAGAVFKPLPQGPFYASYVRNFSILRWKVCHYNTANTVIDPEKTYTIEAGSKWDFFSAGCC